MEFLVTLKGVRCYRGRLSSANRYIEATWGSLTAAGEIGVKLIPVVI